MQTRRHVSTESRPCGPTDRSETPTAPRTSAAAASNAAAGCAPTRSSPTKTSIAACNAVASSRRRRCRLRRRRRAARVATTIAPASTAVKGTTSASAKAAPVTTHPCRAPCFADRPRQNRNPCPSARRCRPEPRRLPRPAAPAISLSRRRLSRSRPTCRTTCGTAALVLRHRKQLPSLRSRNRLRIVFGFARQALIAACRERPWWQLDDWHPRLRPADPVDQPRAGSRHGCSPSQITQTPTVVFSAITTVTSNA
jgi:hypothetical protein